MHFLLYNSIWFIEPDCHKARIIQLNTFSKFFSLVYVILYITKLFFNIVYHLSRQLSELLVLIIRLILLEKTNMIKINKEN